MEGITTPSAAPAAKSPASSRFVSLVALLVILGSSLHCDAQFSPISARRGLQQEDAWFNTEDAKRTIDIILSWQTPSGGWAKNYSQSRLYKPGDSYGTWDGVATIDNGFTYTELRLLARAYTVTKRPEVLTAFNRGLDFLFTMQYPSGGWPQRYPVSTDDYDRYITFNDDAMTNVIYLLRDIPIRPEFAFIDTDRRAKAQAAFDRGVECILNCQITVNGKLTGWCAQHDPVTFEPRGARAFELASISGDEGAAIAILLMKIEHPSDRVKRAIDAAAAWFAASKMTGVRLTRVPPSTTQSSRKLDRVLVQDPAAPPLWARFYDIETNRPFYCGRDGVKRWSLAEIEFERRSGYNWVGPWGDDVAAEYAKWKKRQAADGH
jgi:PelA/Pel-15E family pectate lyase